VKSGIGVQAYRSSPDFALLNPGYASDPTVMKPVTTTGFI